MRAIIGILGVLIIVAGWLAAAYVGIWLMFICGIIQIIDGVKVDPVSSFDIAVGICRVVFAGSAALIGWLGTLISGVLAGGAFAGGGNTRSAKFKYRNF
jgi:hypothetical protein